MLAIVLFNKNQIAHLGFLQNLLFSDAACSTLLNAAPDISDGTATFTLFPSTFRKQTKTKKVGNYRDIKDPPLSEGLTWSIM